MSSMCDGVHLQLAWHNCFIKDANFYSVERISTSGVECFTTFWVISFLKSLMSFNWLQHVCGNDWPWLWVNAATVHNHHHHLFLILSLIADTHFVIPQRMNGLVDLGAAVKVCIADTHAHSGGHVKQLPMVGSQAPWWDHKCRWWDHKRPCWDHKCRWWDHRRPWWDHNCRWWDRKHPWWGS